MNRNHVTIIKRRTILKFKRKFLRSVQRWQRNGGITPAVLTALLLIGIFTYAVNMHNQRLTVDPATYTPLLRLIAETESKGNYNAYFGNASNSSIKFTEMPIAEVMQWQSDYVRQGSPSNAVGKYQIIDTTLKGLVDELGIPPSQPFDPPTQDKLAAALIERRGAEAYINGELTREELAANLAKEWAALPQVTGKNPQDSYYASDGLNKSLIEVDEVLNAIEAISPK